MTGRRRGPTREERRKEKFLQREKHGIRKESKARNELGR